METTLNFSFRENMFGCLVGGCGFCDTPSARMTVQYGLSWYEIQNFHTK